jgi:uncharacterized protein YegL
VVAAVLAALLSLALHAFVLEKLPPMRLGQPATEEDLTRYRPFELARKAPEPAEAVREPARFRPEDPGQLREILVEADILADVGPGELPVPEAPAMPAGPLTGQDKAMVSPALPTTQTPWEPRQDIVQVEEQIFGEKISALPRRFTERVQRSAIAPDIVFPAEAADITLAGGFGSGSEPESLSVSRLLPRGDVEGGGGAATKDIETPEPLFPDGTTEFDEARADITDLKPAEQYLALDVRAFHSEEEPDVRYFEVRISRRGEESLPVLPKDVLFMQDCSESMTAWKLAECKAGLRRALDNLRPGDRFDIMGFRDVPYRCFGQWVDVKDATRARALQFIDDMRAQGNTDVYASLSEAERIERDSARPLIAMLITDGRPTVGTTDSSDIIESFTQANRGNVSMFSFGAGRRVNRFLLDLLSYRNRGDSLVVVDTDRIPSTLQTWSREMSRPVLSDLTYHFSGLDETRVFPSTLTHLYLDRPLVIYGRMPRASDSTAFQVIGRSGAEKRDMVFALDLKNAQPGDESMRTRWAWHRIYSLIGRYIQTRQPLVLVEMDELAQKFGLDVPYGKDIGRPAR